MNTKPTLDPAASTLIRVLIADDHPLVCDGLATKLAAEPDIHVIGSR